MPILKALEERGMLSKIQVITTDLFPELVPYIESGKILATLYQRPYTQGKRALESLLNYILSNVTPPTLTRLAPHIILRSNVFLFRNYLIDSPTC
jgi:LacI family transcriptional regulator